MIYVQFIHKKRTLLKSYLGFTQFSSEHLLATLGHEDDGDLVCVVLRVLRSQLKKLPSQNVNLIERYLSLINQLAAYEVLKVVVTKLENKINNACQFKDIEKLNSTRVQCDFKPTFLTRDGLDQAAHYVVEAHGYDEFCLEHFGINY